MKTITKLLIILVLIVSSNTIAQENEETILQLEAQKTRVEQSEKNALKAEVEAINIRLEKGEITADEAQNLKKEMAVKRALNIENKIAIIENRIELIKRNDGKVKLNDETDGFTLRIGKGEDTGDSFIYLGDKAADKPRKYDRRTTSDLVFAFGLNTAIIEDESLDDSPYKYGGSRFFEIGWAWKTRVFKNSNALRIKYGYSFQINGLKPTDNQYFVENGDVTSLETFPVDLNKSKLSITNLVVPIHFEFGSSKKIEKKTYFRYSTRKQFKIGVGGYAGFNIGTRQKLKYKEGGERIKDKIKRDYNTSNLVYGLSAYVGWSNVGIYAKYDLSPLFKDQVVKQNNLSLGLRFDLD